MKGGARDRWGGAEINNYETRGVAGATGRKRAFFPRPAPPSLLRRGPGLASAHRVTPARRSPFERVAAPLTLSRVGMPKMHGSVSPCRHRNRPDLSETPDCWIFSARSAAIGGASAKMRETEIHNSAAVSDVWVIIFGIHSEDWMEALGPDAPVWNTIAEAKEIIIIADATDSRLSYIDESKKCSVIIPLMETHAKAVPRDIASLVPDHFCIDLLSNKRLFAEFMRERNYDDIIPIHYETKEEAAYPCVLKRLDCNAGVGIAVVDSRQYLDKLLLHPLWLGKDIVLQQFIPGAQEYVTHCVFKNGRLLWQCSFLYKMNDPNPIRGPHSNFTLEAVETAPFILNTLKSILSGISYTGPCNVNYKIVSGNFIIFEINPRLGGSLTKAENRMYLHGALSTIIRSALL